MSVKKYAVIGHPIGHTMSPFIHQRLFSLAGLDAETRFSVGRILKAVSTFAATVVSGHELDELQGLASRFLVLKGGRVFVAKTASEVRAELLPALAGANEEGQVSA